MAFAHARTRSKLDLLGQFWPILVLMFIVGGWFFRFGLFASESAAFDSANRIEAPPANDTPDGEARKLPFVVSRALVHYASTNITPQQTNEEIMLTAKILARRGPCKFLVFGLGFDSLLWATLNFGGHTIFLEEDKSWIAQIGKEHPELKAYHVNYTTVLTQADNLLADAREDKKNCGPVQDLRRSKCTLAQRGLPPEVYATEWDVIMIDAPRGYIPEAPGRMTAIFSAGVMARRGKEGRSTDILLHDVDRPVEKTYSTEFLCAKNLMAEAGKLWHFEITIEADQAESSFCSYSSS